MFSFKWTKEKDGMTLDEAIAIMEQLNERLLEKNQTMLNDYRKEECKK